MCTVQSADVNIAQIGSFGVINNLTILHDWLVPKNKQFSFYRVYPNCVKDQTKKTCKQNVTWSNDLRDYFYNGDYVNFAVLDDAKNLASSAPASNKVTVTLVPLLEKQVSEDNLNITVVCDTKRHSATLTAYAVSDSGQTAVDQWVLSFDPILDVSGLRKLVATSNDDAIARNKDNENMALLRWNLNLTIAEKDTGIFFKDISLDVVVLSSTKKDGQPLFFNVSQDVLMTTLSVLRQCIGGSCS